MIGCPNKSSQEWVDLVKKYNGDEDLAAANWNRDTEDSDLELTKDKPKRSDLGNIVDKTKLFIEKKIAILGKKNIFNKKQKENELKRLRDNLKSLGEVDSISTFIEDSYSKTVEAEKMFQKLLEKSEGYTRSEMIQRLSTFNEFANGYSILDEINEADLSEIRSKKIGIQESGDFSIQAKLLYAIDRKNDLKTQYIKIGIPLLADYLLESKSTKLSDKVLKEISVLESRIKAAESSTTLKDSVKERRIKEAKDEIEKLKPYDLDKENLISQLKMASQDEGAIDYLFSPLISSEDSVLALFAKSVKNKLEDARLKDIEIAEEFAREFKSFEKSNTKSKDNVAKFNEDIYEIVEVNDGVDENGNKITRKEKSFVQKYDITLYRKAMSNFFESIGQKPAEEGESLESWKKGVATWFSENTKPKNRHEINEIINNKKSEVLSGIITSEEYDEWYSSVASEYNGEITYKRELAEPSDKYINKKWLKLYAEDEVPINDAGKYHDFLLSIYLKAQEKLPENFRRGFILPSIQKDNTERVITQGVLEAGKKRFSEAIKVQNYDNAAGITDLSGEDSKFLPVFFTQKMDADDVSSDLLQSIVKFNAMANRYEALNEIHGEISLIKQVVGKREVVSTTSKGEKIIDAFAAKHGYSEFIKKNGTSYSQQHLDAFIDMVVYGEMQKKEEILGLDAGKITNTLLGFSAVTTLAVDLLKSTANNIQGNIQVTIEANSGEHFNKTNLKNGAAYYVKSTSAMLSDFGKIAPETLPSKLIDLYDAIQGEFKTSYGENISGSLARKLFRTNTLFFNQHLAEHEIQVKSLYALLDAQKVLDTESGKQISLLDAYSKYGIDISTKTDFTEDQRKEVMNTHHAIAKRLHGVYNDFDKGTAQRYALGRLAMMYRKYLIPAYKRRYKKISGDQEAGTLTEGFYRTFHRTFLRDLRDLQFNIVENWATYSDFEKGQIKRVIAEAAFITALITISMILKSAGDDDDELKKNYLYNFVLYQAVRQRSETFAYLSPKDAYRTVKSPSALTSTLDRSIKLADQLLFTWDPDKLTYSKKTGVFNKGTNKSYAYFLKLIGLSSYNFNPEEAVKSFEGTLNK